MVYDYAREEMGLLGCNVALFVVKWGERMWSLG